MATVRVEWLQLHTMQQSNNLCPQRRHNADPAGEHGDRVPRRWEDASSVTNCSISTTSEEMATLKLPRLAELHPMINGYSVPSASLFSNSVPRRHGGRSFSPLKEPKAEKNQLNIATSSHAFKDLKAYLCTIGGDKCAPLLFEDRISWFNYELVEYHCSPSASYILRLRPSPPAPAIKGNCSKYVT